MPETSLMEEFKVGKVCLHMMRDSADEFIHRLQPDIKTGTKWLAVETTQEVESSLWTKDIMGGGNPNPFSWPGQHKQPVFLQTGSKG